MTGIDPMWWLCESPTFSHWAMRMNREDSQIIF